MWFIHFPIRNAVLNVFNVSFWVKPLLIYQSTDNVALYKKDSSNLKFSIKMFVILFISAILSWLIVRQYQKVSRLPPGPVSLPLIGNLPQIFYYLWTTGSIVSTLDLFRKVTNSTSCIKNQSGEFQRYGNIFTLWVGPLPHVSIADYEISHEVFVKNGSKYADKFHAPVMQDIRSILFV